MLFQFCPNKMIQSPGEQVETKVIKEAVES
jgi:hypothetical protein